MNNILKGACVMRKRVILAVVLIVAIVAAIGGFHYFNNIDTNNVFEPGAIVANFVFEPGAIVANLLEKEEPAVFDKEKVDCDTVVKFLFKDFDGGCVYSLDHKIFLMTENSDDEKVICYLDCATEENCKPIAITTTGNYMILETEQGDKIPVPIEKSQMGQLIEPREPIAFDNLAEQEKNSLFELIEE